MKSSFCSTLAHQRCSTAADTGGPLHGRRARDMMPAPQREACRWDATEVLLKASLQSKEDSLLHAWVRGYEFSFAPCYPRLHVIADNTSLPRARHLFFRSTPNVTFHANKFAPAVEQAGKYWWIQWHILWVRKPDSNPRPLPCSGLKRQARFRLYAAEGRMFESRSGRRTTSPKRNTCSSSMSMQPRCCRCVASICSTTRSGCASTLSITVVTARIG